MDEQEPIFSQNFLSGLNVVYIFVTSLKSVTPPVFSTNLLYFWTMGVEDEVKFQEYDSCHIYIIIEEKTTP